MLIVASTHIVFTLKHLWRDV